MDWSSYSNEALEKWAETCELRADVDLEGLTDSKKDLLYYVAEEIWKELAERYLNGE